MWENGVYKDKSSKVYNRFFKKVDKHECGCWLWIGSKSEHGYGRIYYQGKIIYAHRLSFEIHNGYPPSDLCVLHKCDNPMCVNPDHLFLGDQAMNNKDMVTKGRQSGAPGVRNAKAKLDDKKVIEIRNLYKKGISQIKIAAKFNVTKCTVYFIIKKKTWTHVQ